MFCSKCGNNVPEGMNFCNKCGASMGSAVNVPPVQTPFSGISSKLPTNPLASVTGNKSLMYYIGILVAQIVILIGWFAENVTVKATIFGETMRESYKMVELLEDNDCQIFVGLMAIGCLISAIPVVLTLVKKSEDLVLAPLVYVGVAVMAVCFAVVFICLIDANDMLGGFAKISLNFWGLLSLLGVVATAVLPRLAKSKN